MSKVTTGNSEVATMTTPGYTSLVAVTSIWQSLVQDTDVRGVDIGFGVTVWMIVVGFTSVIVSDCVTKIVEIVVERGKVKVDTKVDPGRVIVLRVVGPGSVRVLNNVVVVVLAGS